MAIPDSTPNTQQFIAMAGSGIRLIEADANGNASASKLIITGKLSDSTAISLLTNGSNWDANGAYTGTAITGTYEGQYYSDASYFFYAYSDNAWIRIPRVSGSETASSILTKLLTVDGTGSGLDADKLDGIEATGFMKAVVAGSGDLNTLVEGGSYRIGATVTNGATGMLGYGQLLVIRGGSDTIVQIYTNYSDRRSWLRAGNPTEVGGSGSYGAWREFTFLDAVSVFKTIAVSGQSNVVADAVDDTLTLVAGTNMTITTNATNDTITFASTGGSGGVSIGLAYAISTNMQNMLSNF